jgi:uncharacterized membrane protein YdjX (TVP38/TMEM64 family)
MIPPEPSIAKPGFAWARWLVLAVVLAAVAAYLIAGPNKDVAWNWLKDNQGRLQLRVERHPWLTLAIFAAAYVAVTSLSLPIATFVTLLGGALFGRWLGTVVVSFASTAGAALAFLGSRYLLRDWVQARLGPRIDALNRGVERDGIFYLLTLRLLPIVPFWFVNLSMGLTRLPLRTFWWVSQLGMLPMTFVYVNAGTELANIQSANDILSPTLLISMALIALAPLVIRLVVRRMRSGVVSHE